MIINVLIAADVDALGLNDETAIHYAVICADLKQRGAMIGANDLFIAAHGRALSLSLVTNHFGVRACPRSHARGLDYHHVGANERTRS